MGYKTETLEAQALLLGLGTNHRLLFVWPLEKLLRSQIEIFPGVFFVLGYGKDRKNGQSLSPILYVKWNLNPQNLIKKSRKLRLSKTLFGSN